MVRKKVILQPNEEQQSAPSKRKQDESEAKVPTKRGRRVSDEEDAVDYGEEEPQVDQPSAAPAAPEPVQEAPAPAMSQEEEEKVRITKALESWCRNNIAMEKDDPDAAERIAALAEVALLLVLEYEKYPNADSMRTELEDIGSIIGGDVIVTRYINFILSLQNQLKKTRAQAERQLRQQQHMAQQFAAQQGGPFAFPPHGGMMPVMMHPGGHPMYGPPHQVPMYMAPHGFPQGGHPPRGNMTLNASGEMSEFQKRKEKERKRKEILAECTEHLKALLERVTKSTDPTEKAKIYELIDKVKKRIESLKEVTPPPAPVPKAPVQRGPIRGYYGNQYVNPNLLQQQTPAQQPEPTAEGAEAPAAPQN